MVRLYLSPSTEQWKAINIPKMTNMEIKEFMRTEVRGRKSKSSTTLYWYVNKMKPKPLTINLEQLNKKLFILSDPVELKIVQTIINLYGQDGEGIQDIIDRIVTVFTGRDKLPPAARKVVEQYGSEPIVSMTIYRDKIKSVPIDALLNVITLGGYKKLMEEYGYDRLFHLYIHIETSSGKEFNIEKNEVINVEKTLIARGESMTVEIPSGLTMDTLLQKTRDLMGDSKFFRYNAFNNNCQVFITQILKANGLLKPEYDKFINQKVSELMDRIDPSGRLQSLINATTNAAAVLDILQHGAQI